MRIGVCFGYVGCNRWWCWGLLVNRRRLRLSREFRNGRGGDYFQGLRTSPLEVVVWILVYGVT